MAINRRGFLKTLGVAGISLTVGKSFGAAREEKNAVEFNGILYDSTLCSGCQSCEYACSDKYELPYPTDAPVPGVVRTTSDKQRVAVNAYNTSKGPQHIRKACNHCNEPACASACLTKAMLKTDEGPVIWREEKCMGCRSCMISCPFDIPKFEFDSPNPKIQKCRMCYEELMKGDVPACVEVCPQEALTFGKRKDLIELARTRIYAEPEKYNHNIYGEHEVGGTGLLYLASVPFEELGLRKDLGTTSYPEYNKTFLYSVPAVLILWPAFLLGLHNSFKERRSNILKGKEDGHEE
ncbi:MAG: 4Fe-4S dicluster domain-containing protein [Bacteroidales bacterium]|nr:4Fe-4S dicluster domain-containing protein [Bacteroidales bacterium]